VSKSVFWLGAAILAAATGCAPMCQSPWDYCNAVNGPHGTPNCNFIARYNSRYAPMYDTSAALEPTPAAEEDELPMPASAAPMRRVR
jgi:hypothetical protein